jgi:hypothetical protein
MFRRSRTGLAGAPTQCLTMIVFSSKSKEVPVQSRRRFSGESVARPCRKRILNHGKPETTRNGDPTGFSPSVSFRAFRSYHRSRQSARPVKPRTFIEQNRRRRSHPTRGLQRDQSGAIQPNGDAVGAEERDRGWNRSVTGSPGKTRVLAVMPCFTALNRERFFPSGVLSSVLYCTLRRLISARSGLGVVVVVMEVCSGCGCSGGRPQRVVLTTGSTLSPRPGRARASPSRIDATEPL